MHFWFMCALLLNTIQLLSPYTARDIDTVESVQRRFTKRLPTLRNIYLFIYCLPEIINVTITCKQA